MQKLWSIQYWNTDELVEVSWSNNLSHNELRTFIVQDISTSEQRQLIGLKYF